MITKEEWKKALRKTNKEEFNVICQWWADHSEYGMLRFVTIEKGKLELDGVCQNNTIVDEDSIVISSNGYSSDWFSNHDFEYDEKSNRYFDSEYPELSEEEIFFREVLEFGHDNDVTDYFSDIKLEIEEM